MTSTFSISFPTLFVPEKDKNELYHKQFVQAIVNKSILSGYTDRYALMNECVNFYLGLQSGEEFDFLQKAEDGEVLPAKWADYNKIAVKVDLLLGELIKRDFKIDVRAYNKEAHSRKMDEKNRLLLEMRFKPVADMLEETVGLPIQSDSGFIPENEKELDIYMNKSYKDTSEIVMREMLNWCRRYDSWDFERLACFRDLLIMGACFIKHEIVDGVPHMKRKDPRWMIFDNYSVDDFLTDSTLWGEINYMSIKELVRKYNISESELKSAYHQYQGFMTNEQYFASYSADFGFIDRTSRLRLFKQEGGELRILVATAYWQDYKVISNKYSEDKYNGIHVKKMPNDTVGDNVKNNLIQIWRTGTLIGGRFLREWGEMENQTRSSDPRVMAHTEPPYTALIPNFMNGAIVSKVQRLRPMQNLKNIAMYNLQVSMSKAKGKGFVYDVSQLPKGWDLHTAMKYLKIAGIMFIDSSVDGAGPHNQFGAVDMSMSTDVEQYINISMLMDREMDAISGVNEARQGLIQNSSQAVGVTNAALVQSSLSTEVYFNTFSKFFSNSINKQAKLGKIAWAGKEKFSPIIGDVGVDFLKVDVDVDLCDYNVFVKETPPILADQQMFYQMVMMALQSQQISFPAALKLLMEKDIDEGVLELELDLNRQKAEMQAQQQQQNDLQEQQMAQKESSDQQSRQVDAQLQQMKSQTDLAKILSQGKLDLKQSLLQFKESLALKKMDMAIAAQKSKEKAKTRPKA